MYELSANEEFHFEVVMSDDVCVRYLLLLLDGNHGTYPKYLEDCQLRPIG